MTQRATRRQLAAALSVSWTPALAARVRRRVDAVVARRRVQRRGAVAALALLLVAGAGYAFPRVLSFTTSRFPAAPLGPAAPTPAAPSAPEPAVRAPATPSTALAPAPAPASASPSRSTSATRRPPAPSARAADDDEAAAVTALLATADAARRERRFADAVAPLTTVFTRHPSDPRAAIAAFQLGRVLRDDLDDPAGAARAFASALALDPRGPLARDASARAKEALERTSGGSP